ncbi:M48 family metallopeptidase [Mitsuaria sp. GD03876]|uniref:M48 family metallopeptidase n=1 Tax=Mitsuaria sp. GD03876 TaxID=2975399 RepID=UPI00244743F3|nr:M48 family metallopeptidase [Mitsuaria sp. GD03876]MDH0864029.1 M48 family metallopeptidase [Mitsuaria sp. GD03876]
MAGPTDAPTLRADYFDGRSARARPVRLWLEHDHLVVHDQELDAVERRYPVRRVVWPERTRHGQRQAQLPDGGVLTTQDAGAWDDWAQASTGGRGLGTGLAVRWFSSWKHTAVALLAVVLVAAATWRWGVPVAADVVARNVPASIEQKIGDEAMDQLEGFLLKPSQIPAAEQRAWRERFAAMVASQPGTPTPYQLHFRDTGRRLGPNAFALPGGHIVVTDELLKLLGDQPDAVLGVLAHELGHVREQHGMRLMMRASLVGTLLGFAIGDFSSLLAGAPTLLMNASYSRDFERAADAQARQLLIDSGRSPRAMLTLFERLNDWRHDREVAAKQAAASEPKGLGRDVREAATVGAGEMLRIAFSSHPADEERMRFFER